MAASLRIFTNSWRFCNKSSFLKRVLGTVERGLRSATPRPQTVSLEPPPRNVNAESDSIFSVQVPNDAEQAAMEDALMGFIESF